VGAIVSRIGERATLLVGLAFGVVGFLTYGLAPTGALFAVGVPLVSLWGLSNPAMQGLMTQLVEPSEQGRLQGARSSLMGIAGLLGPALFTQTFAAFISTQREWHLPGAPFVLAALLLVAAWLVAWRTTRA
jgi:DHA1 family tetracycline resistance protein-like MFS transporter